VLTDGDRLEQACIDPPQSRVSTAQMQQRQQLLVEHQLENFKSRFGGSINALLNAFKDSEEAASQMINPEFYVKHILQAHSDKDKFPVTE
jgi:hypothetical protein